MDDAKWHLSVTEWLKGGVINSAEMACKFAGLVREHMQSPEMLEQQRPLMAEDRGDTWFVQGSWNRNKSQEGPGPSRCWSGNAMLKCSIWESSMYPNSRPRAERNFAP